MNKKDLIRSMKAYRQGRDFICVAHLAKYREISQEKAAKLVADLPYIREGRRIDYQIEDVAEVLWDRREIQNRRAKPLKKNWPSSWKAQNLKSKVQYAG